MRSADVDTLLEATAHPYIAVIDAIREELLAVPGVLESIKWKAPNYALADDFATMNLRRPQAVQLILHTGAKPKPEHPEIDLGELPAFARRADRNRVVLTFVSATLSEDDRLTLRRMISGWIAQLA